MDNFGLASQIKSVSPQTIVVGRHYDPNFSGLPGDFSLSTVDQYLQNWWSIHQGLVSTYGAVDYWEGYNEPVVQDPNRMAALAQFEARRTQLLNGKSCIGNFATGNPEPALWPNFLAAFQAIQGRGIICLHEYAPDGSMTVDTWNLGRFTRMYQYLDSVGLGNLRTVISEFGIDSGGNEDIKGFLISCFGNSQTISKG